MARGRTKRRAKARRRARPPARARRSPARRRRPRRARQTRRPRPAATPRGTTVTIDLPARPLAYNDAIFSIHVRGEKLGEIRISRGTLDWRSRNAKHWKRLRWERLARNLDEA